MKLSLTFVLLSLVTNFAFADDYLILFKSAREFNQVMRDKNELKKAYFAGIDTDFEIKSVLGKIGVVIVTSKDKNFLRKTSFIRGINIEKEIEIPAPKKNFGYKQPVAWNISPIQKLLEFKQTPLLANIEAPKLDATSDQLSPFLASSLGWANNAVHAEEAWNLGATGVGIRVLDIDKSIDTNHPAFKGSLQEMKVYLPAGYELDPGHGTQVGSVIVGLDVPNKFYGVAPNAILLNSTVIGAKVFATGMLATAINDAITRPDKVDVINMSLHFPETPAIDAALDAAEAAGVTVVASSGNDADAGPEKENVISFPAEYKTVISVGSVDSNLKRSAWSQWSSQLSLVAPGENVLTAVPVGDGCDSFLDVTFDGNTLPVDVACYQHPGVKLNDVQGEIISILHADPNSLGENSLQGKIALVINVGPVEAYKSLKSMNPSAIVIVNLSETIVSSVISDDDGKSFPIPIVNMSLSSAKKIIQPFKDHKPVQAKLTMKSINYSPQTGTSISAPIVAGIVALMKSVNKNLTPEQIRSIIKSTATSMEPECQGRCGAGLINAAEAVKAAQAL